MFELKQIPQEIQQDGVLMVNDAMMLVPPQVTSPEESVETKSTKLSFLGRSYNATIATLETPETNKTVSFRGNVYYLRQPMPVKSNLEGKRRYRGISY